MMENATEEGKIEFLERTRVTDHAFVRYLERVTEMDVKAEMDKILDQVMDGGKTLRENINTLGSGKFTCNGVTYVVVDYAVVSV